MTTTNPVPSNDPTDLLFNAQKLDQVVNGAANSFTDRFGVARRTVAGMNADFDAQLADAESDLNVYRADAASSAAEAFGYLQTIRATSYGAYASDPATDPLGNPPTVGDEYFNTTANLLKRWNGATWQASDINTANLAASSGSSLVGFLPAGIGAVATTVQDQLLWSAATVKSFGAVGDGIADDTAALQKWLAYSGPKWLGAGHFRITAPIKIPGGQASGSAQNFVGAGVNLTSIYADNSSGAFTNDAVIKTDPATDNYFHVFKNFSITSNSASNRVDTGFAIVRCLQSTFENIGMYANGKTLHSVYGIVVEGTYSCTMRGLWLNADITYVNFLLGRTCLDMIIDLLYTSNLSDYHIIADRSVRKYSTDTAQGTQRIIFNTPTMQGARKYAIWIADYDELIFTNMYHENVVSCLRIGKDQATNGFCRDIVFRDCDFFDTPTVGMAQRHTCYIGGYTQIGTKPVGVIFDHCLFENSPIIFGAAGSVQTLFKDPHFYGGADINAWQSKFIFRSGSIAETDTSLQLPAAVQAQNFIGVASPWLADTYKGTWDASTNTPTLSSTAPVGLINGWYYLVTVGGTRNINGWFGSDTFEPGDCVVFDGSQWRKQQDIQGASFKGTWDASTNTPALGSGMPSGVVDNDEYFVAVAGSQTINPSVGLVSFSIGDYVKYDTAQGGWVRVKMSTLTNIKARIAGIVHSVNVGLSPSVNQTVRFYTPTRTFVNPN